jgi:hypothetical protein
LSDIPDFTETQYRINAPAEGDVCRQCLREMKGMHGFSLQEYGPPR